MELEEVLELDAEDLVIAKENKKHGRQRRHADIPVCPAYGPIEEPALIDDDKEPVGPRQLVHVPHGVYNASRNEPYKELRRYALYELAH